MIELREGKKFVRRFLRYSIELRVVRSLLGDMARYLIEFVSCKEIVEEKCKLVDGVENVRSLLEDSEVCD